MGVGCIQSVILVLLSSPIPFHKMHVLYLIKQKKIGFGKIPNPTTKNPSYNYYNEIVL